MNTALQSSNSNKTACVNYPSACVTLRTSCATDVPHSSPRITGIPVCLLKQTCSCQTVLLISTTKSNKKEFFFFWSLNAEMYPLFGSRSQKSKISRAMLPFKALKNDRSLLASSCFYWSQAFLDYDTSLKSLTLSLFF